MDQCKNNHRTDISQMEQELLDKINDLKHICFGMYQQIIPHSKSLSNIETVKHAVQRTASDLTSESLGGINEGDTFLFYRAFYQTSIFFLLGMCNEEDQILLSLRKIANTFSQAKSSPLESTTFYYLLDRIKSVNLSGIDKMYTELCLQYYKDFKKYYDAEMDIDLFINRINNGVNNYADRFSYSCIGNKEKFKEVMCILNNACNDAYFAVYQTWEN